MSNSPTGGRCEGKDIPRCKCSIAARNDPRLKPSHSDNFDGGYPGRARFGAGGADGSRHISGWAGIVHRAGQGQGFPEHGWPKPGGGPVAGAGGAYSRESPRMTRTAVCRTERPMRVRRFRPQWLRRHGRAAILKVWPARARRRARDRLCGTVPMSAWPEFTMKPWRNPWRVWFGRCVTTMMHQKIADGPCGCRALK